GRQKEFDTLRSAWAAAATGRAGLVLVAGAAGAGKSRLVTELAGLVESPGGRVAPARCYQAERSLFAQPLLEAVRSCIAGLPPELVRRLADGWNGTLGELMPWLARLLETVEAFHFLARRLPTTRLLLVATITSDSGAEALSALGEVGRTIELGPLSASEVAALATRMSVAGRAPAGVAPTRGSAR